MMRFAVLAVALIQTGAENVSCSQNEAETDQLELLATRQHLLKGRSEKIMTVGKTFSSSGQNGTMTKKQLITTQNSRAFLSRRHRLGDTTCDIACKDITSAVTCEAGCHGVNAAACETERGACNTYCETRCFAQHCCNSKKRKKCKDGCKKGCTGAYNDCVDVLVKKCYGSCEEKFVRPCLHGCNKDGIKLCHKAMNLAQGKSCGTTCTQASLAVLGLGGGPEDPAADATAAIIDAGCTTTCTTFVASGLTPGTDEMSEAICGELFGLDVKVKDGVVYINGQPYDPAVR
eukprot:TRINITY_DN46932_c0_g1_i1.p1 TRINITY_DN46932_c0_g1~~TRINITY_DN46932_c0_g1_i1.p1  ORF type:complete len:289 (+),score=44.82 TRINITY_DN46932_c0_g1_i1:71-937(+)